uniref:Small ribosomal subunit protein uS3c n=1 Tax=Selaginella lepidophylla TaxID=59777 RepID=A0A3T0IB22_SELLP|nr:ribosomal protein S3 [Selaginella lepidophylla]AZU95847.1 ribosomal protein S3 [Selaginella lepidophylla]
MGRKINPLGFRLGITKNYHSDWFAKPKIYPEYLAKDKQIRDCVETYVRGRIRNSDSRDGAEGIERVDIGRKTDLLLVEIRTESPAVLIKSHGRGIEQLGKDVQQILSDKIGRVHVTLTGISKPYGEPSILAKYMASQLRNRVAFRRTMKRAIELASKNGRKGIKIQIAGRLNGAEIARVEWARGGRVPLQTLRAQIDYCYYPAQTIHGVLGIKVWVLKDGPKC